MKYTIIGGCGFIGSNLIKSILRSDRKNDITVIDDLRYDTDYYTKHKTYRLIRTDINGYRIENREADVVIYLAGNTSVMKSLYSPVADIHSNVANVVRCLKNCKESGVKRFVYASSGAVYGNQSEMPLREDMTPNPISPYGINKLTSEYYCKLFAEISDMDTVSLRFSNVYGPYSMHKNSFIHKFIKAMFNGEKAFPIYGDGSQTRDFIYVQDVVDAIQKFCVESINFNGESYNVSTGKQSKVIDIAVIIKGIINNDMKDPHNIEFVYDDPSDVEVLHNCSDNSKLKKCLGYYPQTNIYDGLYKTIQWYKGELY